MTRDTMDTDEAERTIARARTAVEVSLSVIEYRIQVLRELADQALLALRRGDWYKLGELGALDGHAVQEAEAAARAMSNRRR